MAHKSQCGQIRACDLYPQNWKLPFCNPSALSGHTPVKYDITFVERWQQQAGLTNGSQVLQTFKKMEGAHNTNNNERKRARGSSERGKIRGREEENMLAPKRRFEPYSKDYKKAGLKRARNIEEIEFCATVHQNNNYSDPSTTIPNNAACSGMRQQTNELNNPVNQIENNNNRESSGKIEKVTFFEPNENVDHDGDWIME
ncbi:unnamed protein product [Leptosia nina]|uniref:Uncharacterized protein n=1 Tax=Leptosia nina TaxID=320188 RepID=A0AAV1JYU1_9NEOP